MNMTKIKLIYKKYRFVMLYWPRVWDKRNDTGRYRKMMNWYDRNDMVMSFVLSEDTGVPELRNPNGSAMTARGLFSRLFGR